MSERRNVEATYKFVVGLALCSQLFQGQYTANSQMSEQNFAHL